MWPWLVLLVVRFFPVYTYGQATAAWDDTVRMRRDLVLLF